MTDEKLLHEVLGEAVSILRRTLLAYWPSEGLAEIPEATTLLAIAHALHKRGFLTYSQVQVADRRSEHIDLFAFSQEAGLAVAIEGKRLFRADGAGAMYDDWNRLHEVTLAREYGGLPAGLRPYVAIVATTWDDSITSWWGDLNDRGRGAAWGLLADEIRGIPRKTLLVQEDQQWKWGCQHLLYAFQAREIPFTL